MKVFKYQLPKLKWKQTLLLPKGFKIHSLIVQEGVPTLYVLINSAETEKVEVDFFSYGSGHTMSDYRDEWVALGTLTFFDTTMTLHYFMHLKTQQ